MSRLSIVPVFVVLILSSCTPGFCQVPGGCYYGPSPAGKPCAETRPAPPLTRTVQVDVPVPCAPVTCLPVSSCAPYPCCPPVCSPPRPTRPVQVRVEVRVRPEPCGPQPRDTKLCADPLLPVFGLVAATMAVPIRILEAVLPFPDRCPPLRPLCGPACPLPFCAPAPVCTPTMPTPAYQKCVPRSARGALSHPAYYRPTMGPAVNPGHSPLIPIQRPSADLGNSRYSGSLAEASSLKGGIAR